MEKIFDFSGCLPAHYPLGNDILLELNGRHQLERRIVKFSKNVVVESHLFCQWIWNLKSRIHEFTDAGPGVGVTNHDVKFRIAEVVMITNPDYYVRHHLANNDSSHNEVERIQSYVGDAICDGGPLEWEYR